jgi:hypothetical protein
MASHSRLIPIFLFYLLTSGVHAAAIRSGSGPSIAYSSSGASVNYSNDFADLMGRAIKNDNIGGGAKVVDNIAVNTSRGAISARATTAVSARAIARGAAAASRAFPVAGVAIGVGSLVWDLIEDNRIKPDGQGGLNQDPGVPQEQFEGPCWRNGWGSNCYSSAESAANAAVAAANSANAGISSFSLERVVITEGGGYYLVTVTSLPGGNSTSGVGYPLSLSLQKQKRCPPDVNGYRPDPDRDERCPTGSYSKPLTNDQAADILEKDVKDQKDKVPLVSDILGSPGGAIDIEPGATTTSGPSSQTGPAPAPLVVNGPAGQTTTTESPGIAIRYRGNEIEWEPQQVTVRRPGPNPGDPETEETTDAPDEPSVDPGANPTKVVVPDYCIDHPKRAGCSELGEVEPPEWNPDEKPIELRAESPWGSDSASCPPPRTLTIAGRQYQWEWTLVCQFFSGIRFAVLTVAWVTAVMIFLGARNES